MSTSVPETYHLELKVLSLVIPFLEAPRSPMYYTNGETKVGKRTARDVALLGPNVTIYHDKSWPRSDLEWEKLLLLVVVGEASARAAKPSQAVGEDHGPCLIRPYLGEGSFAMVALPLVKVAFPAIGKAMAVFAKARLGKGFMALIGGLLTTGEKKASWPSLEAC
ncbi:uncharacterized protein LOC104449922 [Eucalyptus grandis]|uniref:uncharacterized protein LOC104449922 n=1 Tax=Eucalyptus grandis TaxID=71139 RepID=UPI00192E96EA|nr:uncharacterized protein LOC104449922 [Eucalyptus grandis]